jgi:hypothetical protein
MPLTSLNGLPAHEINFVSRGGTVRYFT